MKDDAGFTLLETLVAMLILVFGLLALAQAFVIGMTHMASSSFDVIAREKAREAVESVHTARDTRTIVWAQIRNVGRGGVFLDGAQALRGVPGSEGDGLVNTADDTSLPEQVIVTPGPDQILGTRRRRRDAAHELHAGDRDPRHPGQRDAQAGARHHAVPGGQSSADVHPDDVRVVVLVGGPR